MSKLVENAAGRPVPTEINGEAAIPFQGVGKHRPAGRKAAPPIRSCGDYPADGDKVVARVTFSGTHQGDFMGIPASGNHVEWDVIDILQFRGDQANGRGPAHYFQLRVCAGQTVDAAAGRDGSLPGELPE